jgi:hypothetical protein
MIPRFNYDYFEESLNIVEQGIFALAVYEKRKLTQTRLYPITCSTISNIP